MGSRRHGERHRLRSPLDALDQDATIRVPVTKRVTVARPCAFVYASDRVREPTENRFISGIESGHGMGSSAETDIGQGPARALRGATLALIVERGGHGYELAHRLNRRLGPTWQIDPKQIYPILDQFEKVGLVTCTEEATPGRPRQARFVYHATEQAPAALARWMRSPVSKEPLRADVLARLAVATPDDAPQLLHMLDEYEAEVLALIEAAHEEEPPVRSWATLRLDVTRDHADAHLQAELAWTAVTRRRIREATERA